MKDPESLTWEEWGAIFHNSVKHFVRDADNAAVDPDSPMGKLVASLRSASEEYERALATQDTERLDLPER